MTSHEEYMQLALAEARKAADIGEIPIGAVLVCGEKIIAAAHNMRESWQDGTAHAEIIVIQEACKKLGRWRLSGCTLYVTVEPCPMCSGAIVNSRIDTVVYGCPDVKAGGAESIFNIITNPNLNHCAEVVSGVCEEECAQVMKDFFQRRRQENKARKQQASAKMNCCQEEKNRL
ncbi:tRNA adenosine(34) deaminase TadA [uncultured Phascolarctobacterium sp.]|uniref:tRNA adenosine(34) deaminase TadA n=1 Tax=uncultured Phascolarctobacterium sp. TaxID=512296 RepID=UPI00260B6856|nr:tRNA adenosine(34) deaminase TadA [uncultured Phascolarctobacterium sp.]